MLFTSDRGITPAAAATLAEDHGFSTFYVPEHTHSGETGGRPSGPPATRPCLTIAICAHWDPWVSLATAAAVTSRVRLSTAVAPRRTRSDQPGETIATSTICPVDASASAFDLANTDELADHKVPRPAAHDAPRVRRGDARTVERVKASFGGEFVQFGPAGVAQTRPAAHTGARGAAGTEKNFRWIARSADAGSPPAGFRYRRPGPATAGDLGRRRTGPHRSWRGSSLGARETPSTGRSLGDRGVVRLPDKSPAEVGLYVERLGRQPRRDDLRRRDQARTARLPPPVWPTAIRHRADSCSAGPPGRVFGERARNRLLVGIQAATTIPVRTGQS